MNQPVYRPKRLAWEQRGHVWIARTSFGELEVAEYARGWWRFSEPRKCKDANLRSLEAAQAAAQSWYDARMIEWLEEVKDEA